MKNKKIRFVKVAGMLHINYMETQSVIVNTLDRKNLRRWINALRSNEYNQGYGLLYDWVNDAYCCLGVFCKINTNDFDDDFVVTWLTAAQQQPMGVYDLNLQKFFSALNDNYKLSFGQIADVIETILNMLDKDDNSITELTF